MQYKDSQVQDESSILHHNVPHLPIAVSIIHLSDFEKMDILHHWNDDFTLITVTRGHPVLQISGKDICLHPGDCVLINIQRKHRIYSPDHKDATFICILASPQLILTNFPDFLSANDLAEPIYPSYYLLPQGTEENRKTVNMIKRSAQLNLTQPSLSSLRILGYLHLILAQFMLSIYQEQGDYREQPDPDYRLLQKMQDYIHHHYQNKLLLNQIAAAGGICSSRCCHIFQKYLHQRPMEYANSYRLSISRRYLVDRSTQIADVANICGFSDQSYYTKLFVRKYGFTPQEYRKRVLAVSISYDSEPET